MQVCNFAASAGIVCWRVAPNISFEALRHVIGAVLGITMHETEQSLLRMKHSHSFFSATSIEAHPMEIRQQHHLLWCTGNIWFSPHPAWCYLATRVHWHCWLAQMKRFLSWIILASWSKAVGKAPIMFTRLQKNWSVRETPLTSIFFGCKTYCGDPTERSIERSCHSWSGFTTFDITCSQQAPWKCKLARVRLAVTSKLFKSWCMPRLVNWLDWSVQALISVSKHRCEMVTEMESPLNQQFFIVCTGASCFSCL